MTGTALASQVTVTATPAAAAKLVKISGDDPPQSAPPDSALKNPFVVRVTDQFGNGVSGVTDGRFYSHYSLLKTIEAAFDLPYIGHAADSTTNTLAPLLKPRD